METGDCRLSTVDTLSRLTDRDRLYVHKHSTSTLMYTNKYAKRVTGSATSRIPRDGRLPERARRVLLHSGR